MSGDTGSSDISRMSIGDLASSLGTDPEKGLSSAEASSRLTRYGYNRLTEARKKGFLDVLMREIREPMILLLIIVAVIYTFLGNTRDSATIFGIVLVVVFFEVYNINRARKSMEALKTLTSLSSVVYRDGQTKEVKSSLIVPGDVLILSSGDRVPADGRLTDSYNLKVDESSLTGESFPVQKDFTTTPTSTLLAELSNMVFSGTLVVQGSGKMIVTSTGKSSQIGVISSLVEEAEEPDTPLEKSMSRLAVILAVLAIFFSAFIPVLGYFEGQPVDLMIITGLSLAFATLPEELPIVISVTLAAGAYALSRKKAIVRSLRAAETLGNVTVIATDKTGTITENRMSVGHTYFNGSLLESEERPDDQFMNIGVLSTGTLLSDVRVSQKYKDPMEVAVLEYSRGMNIDIRDLRSEFSIVEEFGFDNRIKMSSYIYREGDGFAIYVSGAPEVILANAVSVLKGNEVLPMSDAERAEITSIVERITDSGERIIAVSFRDDIDPSLHRSQLEKELVFAGLISFTDPPRKEIREAISDCQDAGIRVIMLTGDHPKTARSIAKKVGINHNGSVLTGSDLSRMDDETLSEALNNVSIFARITSEDKLRIVRLLESEGEIIAVTGDGVNDSPALQTAQIGIAMGVRGTDVAKEASDMILMDDNFTTIVDAVKEGRVIYHTLRKGVKYYLTVKLSLVLIFIIPVILSIPFPFSPIQIIVIELFMDVAALGAFISERGESGMMQNRPKTNGTFLDTDMRNGIMLGSAGLVAAVTALYLFTYYVSGNIVEAQTSAFATWVLSQVFLAQNLRTEREPLLRKGFFANRIILLWGTGVIVALAVITAFPQLQFLLSTSSLTAADWVLVIVASMLSSFWMEAVKLGRSGGKKAVSTPG